MEMEYRAYHQKGLQTGQPKNKNAGDLGVSIVVGQDAENTCWEIHGKPPNGNQGKILGVEVLS